ncbi:xanthine dehydrogenase family protein molybdopterin-binding subunit [Pseudorhodoplanes sinuspersici]|uniref:Aldehyde dehydrogenase n=1 Tax=Pseudorhodoplanes sinuspersici TaxID=1235591 RepID=A0A1W6ZTZ7_9HYPH|nr:molybdopterin cofactor-binding domain-containing protein [Pseudorhodoplanes sinuspersici]ARQ00235.1 aldehyde dehydrogenase [Pseudorhodoplanes sinuspersici]RKE67618.1 isoquinoline 1-oxidoreductase beta subunit [Pseudorhodoplanes sinuspersici]
MNFQPKINRRAFVIGSAAVGGGLALGIPFGGDALAQAGAADQFGENLTPNELGIWVAIKPDDTVAIRVVRAEMGQGSQTGLAQLIAEELDCDWAKVTTEYPTPMDNVKRKRAWGNYNSSGSRAIRESHQYVREGGAAARLMLIQAAANEWKVPASECTASAGVITHKASNRTTTYGKVAAAAAKLPVPEKPALKDPKDWKIAGKPLKRLDTADKVVGKMMYSIDFKMPGMLSAAIKDCPVFGGKVKSFDASKVSGMKGVKKVLQVDDKSVAVVADTWWQAKTALDALPIEWDKGENEKVSSESIAKWLEEGLTAENAYVGNKQGDATAALSGAAKKVEAVYAYPFQNHVCLEPMNATVLYTPEKCEVWTSTQNGEAAYAATIAASGLRADQCEIHRLMLGTGFGRRTRSEYVTEAVLIAKQMPGIPVKLLKSREEDMTNGVYHPVTQCKLTGALDKDNNLVGLHMRISGQSILSYARPEAMKGGADPIIFQGLNPGGAEGALGYDIPNLLIDHSLRNPHVPPWFWRGVNNNQNAIYLECFIDELAQAAGQDPLAFRRKMMAKHPKHLAVLNAVAERVGWDKPAPQGIFRGLCQHMGYGSYVAAAAEVSVQDNKVKMHRIVAATNPGHAVNPAQIERQIAGSFVYGLSALFHGGITIKDGAVVETNFDTYDSLRMAEMPKVESVIMPSNDFWGGVGEPTIFVAAPAVLNAIFAATGRRYRTFPLKNHNLEIA